MMRPRIVCSIVAIGAVCGSALGVPVPRPADAKELAALAPSATEISRPSAVPPALTAPATPLPSAFNAPAAAPVPRVTSISIAASGAARLAGLAEPHCTVTVRSGFETLGRATSDAAGRFVVEVPAAGIGAGHHELVVLSSDPVGGHHSEGERLRLSLPEGFSGDIATVDMVTRGTVSAAVGAPAIRLAQAAPRDDTRLRAEDLARAATQRFDELVPPPGTRQLDAAEPATPARPRLAQAQPAPQPPPGDGSVLGTILDWVERANRDYQNEIVRRLSGDQKPVAAEPAPAARPPVTAQPAPASPPRQPPQPQVQAQARPQAPTEPGMLDTVQDWFRRANQEYQGVVVKRLSEPAAISAETETERKAAEDAARKSEQERRDADARRQAEARQQEAARRAAELAVARKAEEDRKAAEERRAVEERRLAEARRIEDEIARKAAADRRIAEEAQIQAQAQAAAQSQALAKAEQQQREADARRQAELGRLAEARRADEEAAARKAAEDAAARRAAEERRQAELKRLAETRRAEEEAAVRRAVEERRQAELKRQAEAKRLEDETAARRVAEDAVARRAEQERRAADARTKAEAERKAADDRRLADAKAVADRAAEEARKTRELADRMAAESRLAADEARRAEQQRRAGLASAEAARRAADAQQQADARRDAERRAAEEARKADDTGRAAEAARQKGEARRRAELQTAAEASRAADAARAAEEARRRAAAASSQGDRKAALKLISAEARKAEEARRRAETAARLAQETGPSSAASAGRQPGSAPTAAPAAGPAAGTTARVAVTRSPGTPPVVEEGSALTAAPARRRPIRSGDKMCFDRAGQPITPPGTYVVAKGDTLWEIAEIHYKKGTRYTRIFRANRKRIADPDLIYPCQRLYLPARAR